jgi:hypothetical protein
MKSLLLLLIVPLQLCAQWQTIGELQSYSAPSAQEVHLQAGAATVRITFLAPDLCRVRLVRPGEAAAAGPSWAVTRHDWPPVPVSIEDTPGELRISSDRLVVAVRKQPLRISFRDPDGRVINSDHPGKGMSWCGEEVRVWKTMPAGEPKPWNQPLSPHNMTQIHSTADQPIPTLISAEMRIPVARNFLILAWSARKPSTSLPKA